jgi:hypothetical protein
MRTVAIDWSGARVGAERHIWLAEAAEPHRLVRLEGGRSREAVGAALQRLEDPHVAIGIDFAFGVPAWFAHQLGLTSAPQLWALADGCGEDWLRACQPPFWGRPGRPRPALPGSPFRQTERQVPPTAGILPKSIFQISGPGAVGTGSIRGMPLLGRLRAAGAAIWPFDPPGWPLVVEIYPRLLSGPVRKSQPAERCRLLEQRYPSLDRAHLAAATQSEDAFDAAISALVMLEHAHDLATLPPEADPIVRLEGRIWHPGWRAEVRLPTEQGGLA